MHNFIQLLTVFSVNHHRLRSISVSSSDSPANESIAQWLERQTRDRKVVVRVPAEAAGEFFFSRDNFNFCADSFFGI